MMPVRLQLVVCAAVAAALEDSRGRTLQGGPGPAVPAGPGPGQSPNRPPAKPPPSPPPLPPRDPPHPPPPPYDPGFLLQTTETVSTLECGDGAALVTNPGGRRRLQDPCDNPIIVSYEETETDLLRFCVNCPPACKARNQALLSAYVARHADDENHNDDSEALLSIGLCLEFSPKADQLYAAIYDDGICDDDCNNLDCAHDLDDCDYSDIYAMCVPEQSANRTWVSAPTVVNGTVRECNEPEELSWQCPSYEEESSYTAIFDSATIITPNTGRVQVGLQISLLEPLSLKYQETDASMLVTAKLQYRVRLH